jgi:kynureninase
LDTTIDLARQLDKEDPISHLKALFHLPNEQGMVYMCGNSLGLQPKSARQYLENEMKRWQDLGVEGHFMGDPSWMHLHELMSGQMASIVSALPSEVTIMNTLTVNLHLLMVSFYRPTAIKYKILVEFSPFPSDRYMLQSQIKWHGLNPEECIVEMIPKAGLCLSIDEIQDYIHLHKDSLALVFIGGVNYYTGQFYDLKHIAKLCLENDICLGLDLAHAAGNVPLNLHNWGVDFAAWCTYKYLNGGPGSLAGAYVHERHHDNTTLPKLKGWWGHDISSRFKMDGNFIPALGIESWQISNLPILALPTLRSSLEVFDQVGMEQLRTKSILLTKYLSDLISSIGSDNLSQITPEDPHSRGCQLSILVKNDGRRLFDLLRSKGILPDYRYPDVIRFSPVPLYTSFEDTWHVYDRLKASLSEVN